MIVHTNEGKRYTLDRDITGGGEGRIFGVAGDNDVIAKIYHASKRTSDREHKLKAMLRSPPEQPRTHTAIAWPHCVLYEHGGFVGYLMPFASGSDVLIKYSNPRMRRLSPGFNWKYLHTTALNLTIAVSAVHRKGHVIGDVNESNILVSPQTLVTLVDTDSFQVSDLDSTIYPCEVGRVEFTPPELHGVKFSSVHRTDQHDRFGLAILIFQLLMQGFHPFAGVVKSGITLSSDRVDLYAIRHGIFPHGHNVNIMPPLKAPPFNILHPRIQDAFRRCFVDGHHNPGQRPDADAWRSVLSEAVDELKACNVDAEHVYSGHLSTCPWCLQSTPLPTPLPTQTALPAPFSTLSSLPLTPTPPTPPKQRFRSGVHSYVSANKRNIILVACIILMSLIGLRSLRALVAPQKNDMATTQVARSRPSQSVTTVQKKDVTKKVTKNQGQRNMSTTKTKPPPVVVTQYPPVETKVVMLPTQNPKPPKPALPTLEKPRKKMMSAGGVALSRDGLLVACGLCEFDDGVIKVWSTVTRDQVAAFKQDVGAIQTVFSPTDNILITGSLPYIIHIWDLQSKKLLQKMVVDYPKATARGRAKRTSHQKFTQFAISPGGKEIASVGWDKLIRLWDIKTGIQHAELRGHTSSLFAVAYSPDGKWIVSGGQGFKIFIWDRKKNTPVKAMKVSGLIESVSFSPDSQYLAVAAWDYIVVYKVPSGKQKWITKGGSRHSSIHKVAFSPDGASLFFGGYIGVGMLNAANGKFVRAVTENKNGDVTFAISMDGTRLASNVRRFSQTSGSHLIKTANIVISHLD